MDENRDIDPSFNSICTYEKDEKPEDVGLLLSMIILNSNTQEPSQCYACLPHDWGSANPCSITMGPEGGVRLLHRD